MHTLGLGAVRLRAGAVALAALAAVLGTAGFSSNDAAAAEPANLEGSWSGGGTVRFPSGDSERARCRASFRKRGGSAFAMTAVCATASARVEQTAYLERSGANRFSGDFNNAEFGVSGSINVTVNGNSLSASLSGGGGSAQFHLGR